MTRREQIEKMIERYEPHFDHEDRVLLAELRALWAVLDAVRELVVGPTDLTAEYDPVAIRNRLRRLIDAYDTEGGEND